MKKPIKNVERPKTALIYTRVSSKEQMSGFSLQSQEKACIDYCHQNGWDVLKVYDEEGESAKTAERTKLQLMQKFCLQNIGKVGYVVVWKVDRFARNQYDHFTLKKFFSQIGVELRSATEIIENTPMGQATEGMLAVIAQYENAIKTERTLMGMKTKALDGYWPVKAPWGYQNNKGQKTISPDQETSAFVKFIFEEYARGTIKVSDLAKKVRAMGAKSKHGLKMSKQLVYKILRNPIHVGRVVIHKWGIDVKGNHAPIVDDSLFSDVQDLLDGKRGHKQARSRDHPDFLLRGVLCNACDGVLTGGYSTGKMGKKYPYYGCVKKGCPKRGAIKKKDIEEEFTAFLKEITPDEAILDGLAEAITVVHERTEKNNIEHARKIDTQLVKIDKELDELINMRLQKVLNDEDYYMQSERRKSTKRELEVQKNQLVRSDAAVEADVKFAISLIKELPMMWQKLEPGELRVLRGLLFPENLRYKRPLFKTPILSAIYKLKSSSSDDLNRYVTLRGIEPRFKP